MILTPKEKAAELVKKMYAVHSNSASDITLYFAKQCAMIAVDELITAHNKMKDFLFSEIGYLITSPDYWKEVKREIENYEQTKTN
jgi:hypothetical protein